MFEFRDEILSCDHSNKSYCAVFLCAAVFLYAVLDGSNFRASGRNPRVPKPLRATLLCYGLLIML